MREPMELAWAAGFFDGEGCFTCYMTKGRYLGVAARIGQAHPAVLERFRDAVGFGRIHGPYRPPSRKPNNSPQWSYIVDGFHQTQALGAILWKYLSPVKQDQFERKMLEIRAYRKTLTFGRKT